MCERLKKIYMALLAPAIVGFIAISVLRYFQYTIILPGRIMAVMAPAIFILATVFALAGPLFYRSLFAHRQRNMDSVPRAVLYGYERNLIVMALVTPYLSTIAYYLQLPRFHLTATLLLALYAVYYFFPTQRRVVFDKKIFRVGGAPAANPLRSPRPKSSNDNGCTAR